MVKTETFRNVIFSDKDLFDVSDDRVSLKRYKDDLLFYTSFDATKNATFYKANQVPVEVGTNALENFGVFAQHVNVDGSITYAKENFDTLLNEGSVNFRVRAGYNTGLGYQLSKGNFSTPTTGDYYFDVYVDNVNVKSCHFSLTSTSTMSNLLGYMTTQLSGTVVKCVNDVAKLKVYTDIPGVLVEIRDPTIIPTGDFSLVNFFGGMNKPIIPNAPTTNTTLFSLTDNATNKNKVELVHTTTGTIIGRMYDKNGVLVVERDFGIFSNSYLIFYAFELCWTDSTLSLFIDGKLVGVEPIELDRDNSGTFLVLNGSATNIYKIDELIVYTKIQHYKNYEVATAALTPYPTSLPYVDIEFGNGFTEETVKDLNISCSANIHLVVKIGNTWYYYFSGDWRQSDGSFSQSNGPGEFESKFASLYFNEDASLIIRAYFESDGVTESWLDEVSIVSDDDSEKAASIVGTVAITGTVDVSVNNKIKITTNLGTMDVDVSTAAADPTAATLEEIKQAINNASVPGLDVARDDGFGHLVLQTTTKGSEAYISVSEADADDALDIVWGYEATDLGEEAGVVNTVDYTPLFDFVRMNLGAPIVPVELTDGQLEVCLQEAVEQFNKYRNFDENIHYMPLTGNGKDGYEIPAIVGGREFITDIIFKPRLPFSQYTFTGEMATNIYIQQLFHKFGRPGGSGFLADYYLNLSFINDMDLILGTTPRWEILNGRLFLHPRPPSNITIGIKYKSPLSIGEILNNNQIRKYVLAKAKIILGTIRSTFGGTMPGGGENLQLNGADLISQGREELEAVRDEMQKQQMPLLIEIG